VLGGRRVIEGDRQLPEDFVDIAFILAV